MKYIKSNFPHAEHHFPAIGKLPPVTLPKSFYRNDEIAVGKRSVIAISDQQFKRLQGDEVFEGMLRRGDYEILDEMPADVKTQGEVLAEKEDEIASLKDRIAELESGGYSGKGKKGGKKASDEEDDEPETAADKE